MFIRYKETKLFLTHGPTTLKTKQQRLPNTAKELLNYLGRIKKRKCLRTRKSALGLPYIAQNFGINIDTI